MNKKRAINIFLIIAVVAIWYLIANRVIKDLGNDNAESFRKYVAPENTRSELVKEDNIFMEPLEFTNSRPFINNSSNLALINRSPPIVVDKQQKENILPADKNSYKEDLKYLGLIKNPRSKDLLGLLQVKNQLFQVFDSKQINDSIFIVKMKENQITVKINNEVLHLFIK